MGRLSTIATELESVDFLLDLTPEVTECTWRTTTVFWLQILDFLSFKKILILFNIYIFISTFLVI